ncbi:hypothetical protein [Paractinoplanes toevensis]|uniref:Uncharacterized protein n=1 Tax=Paractinoplanes toevensis TaxID=571911 RepID=A0A919T6U9_9ACTN|nr:hypothetical protein [Actinoplanes toevensis]GIM90105.1 hypothetical protein Ato02nite_018980 [Actinoplanes toevensis]
MSAHMSLRDLYLPADRIPDLPAAKTAATTLCRNATIEDLRTLLDNDWIEHPSLYGYELSDEQIRPHQAQLRVTAEQRLHELLAAFMTSLAERDVVRFPYDRTRSENPGHTVDAYVTGGVTPSDALTDSYEAWDIAYADDKFPTGWCVQLSAALGLIHPQANGPTAATVTFYRWSSSPAGETAAPADFTYTLTVEQRDTLQGALEDAYHSRDDGVDDSFPVDGELREKYERLAEHFGLTPDW